MKESRFWLLLSKKMSGEASEDELKELAYWMGDKDFPYHEDHRMARELWQQPFENEERPDSETSWSTLAGKLALKGTSVGEHPHHRFFKGFFRRGWIAAAFVLLLAGAGYLYTHTAKRVTVNRIARQNEVSVRNGSRTRIVLPDGSTLWLNGGSRLYYDKSFGQEDREVYLTGEGYFEVVGNPNLPFIVHAGVVDVRVLGTSFDVKAYPNERKTEATLIKGKIELTLYSDPARKVLLKPLEKITLTDEMPLKAAKIAGKPRPETPSYAITSLVSAGPDSPMAETAWLNNKFVFKGQSFKDLAREIERWYGVTLVFADSSIERRKFTGVFDRLSLEQALEALRFSSKYGFNYEVKNSEVTIRP